MSDDISYETITRQIADWCKNQQEIRSLIQVGSRSRVDHPADQWSDLDLVLVISEPLTFQKQEAWLDEVPRIFHDAWLIHDDREAALTPDWLPLLTLFIGEYKADIVLLSISPRCLFDSPIEEIIRQSSYPYVFSSGMQTIWDALGDPESNHPGRHQYIVNLPTQEVFHNHISSFWIQAIQVSKLIGRGEWWRAEQEYYCSLRRELLIFIEWLAAINKKPHLAVWPRGRFLEEWADPYPYVSAAHNNPEHGYEGLWVSLVKTCHDFSQYAEKIASKSGYKYPLQQQERTLQWIQKIEKQIKVREN